MMNSRGLPDWARASLVSVVMVILLAHCGPRSTFKQADEFVQRGRFQQAIETLRTYYLDNPFTDYAAEALLRIGNIYRLNLKDFTKATEAYSVLTNRFPESAAARQAQLMLGSIYDEQFHDQERAIVEYQRVVAGKGYNQDERAKAKLATGNAYYRLGSFQQARIEFEGVRQMQPDSLYAKTATLKLAQAYDADEDYDNAMAFYKQVAEFTIPPNIKTPEQKALHNQLNDLVQQGKFGRAACLEELGHHQEALSGFREILETYPNRNIVEIHIDRLTQRQNQVKP